MHSSLIHQGPKDHDRHRLSLSLRQSNLKIQICKKAVLQGVDCVCEVSVGLQPMPLDLIGHNNGVSSGSPLDRVVHR